MVPSWVTQWAAVSTSVGLMIEPPQASSVRFPPSTETTSTKTCHGNCSIEASCPPTISGETRWPGGAMLAARASRSLAVVVALAGEACTIASVTSASSAASRARVVVVVGERSWAIQVGPLYRRLAPAEA